MALSNLKKKNCGSFVLTEKNIVSLQILEILLSLNSFIKERDLLSGPIFVKQSASCKFVGTQSMELTFPISINSFKDSIVFLNNFSSHCFVLFKFSHTLLLSIKA